MKKYIVLTVISLVSLVSHAQFVLTPNDGLKSKDNVYVIRRVGTELENYYAAKRVLKAVIPDVYIEDLEFEKVITAKAEAFVRLKPKGWVKLYNAFSKYTMKIEVFENELHLSFVELGPFELRKKNGNVHAIVHPYSGHNSFWNQFEPYLFNSSGDASSPKAIAAIENWANGLVAQIEKALKE